MNKGQLIDAVAAELNTSKTVAGKAIEAVIKSITRGIEQHDAVTISGFGTFTKKDRPARTGINPATRKPMEIKASKTVNFRPSPHLKDALGAKEEAGAHSREAPVRDPAAR